MITQTYTFRGMPKWIRENTDGKRDRFVQSVAKDVSYEMEESLFPPVLCKSGMDVTGHDLLITFHVDAADARFLEIALHNLHSAKLLN